MDPNIRDQATHTRFMPIGGRLAGTANDARAIDVTEVSPGIFGLLTGGTSGPGSAPTSKDWSWAALGAAETSPAGDLATNALSVASSNAITLYVDWTAGGGSLLTLTAYSCPTADANIANWFQSTSIESSSGISVAYPETIQLGTAGKHTIMLRVNDPYFVIRAEQDAGSGTLAIKALAGNL